MPLGFLSKLKKNKGGVGASESGAGNGAGAGGVSESSDGFKRDPRKAAAFFNHAETTAESRSYDYSVECYINGLRHDPDNLARHEELREVAKKRKVGGGKPAKMAEKLKTGGSFPIDKMLHAEKLWSLDPLNVAVAIKTMEHAVDAMVADAALNIGELAYWLGENVLKMIHATKKADKRVCLQVCDLFARIPAYDKAVEACRMALALDPKDSELPQKLKDLEIEETLQAKRYGSGQQGDFRANIIDADKQQALEDDDAITKTASVVDSTIERRRKDYQETPDELEAMNKLIAALLAKEDEQTEQEAIQLLTKAWEQTNQYKFKMQIGDVRIRQMRRQLRAVRTACESERGNVEAKAKMKDLTAQMVQFELAEFTERAKQYPTDTRIRFELGCRFYANKQHDEAIAEFQRARGDPKHRAASCHYLGHCFLRRGWFDEAIDTLHQGIEAHGSHDDKLGMSLRYVLMDALEKSATQTGDLDRTLEAQKMASQILQTDINYRDIRDRMDRLKKLVGKLQT